MGYRWHGRAYMHTLLTVFKQYMGPAPDPPTVPAVSFPSNLAAFSYLQQEALSFCQSSSVNNPG